MATYTKPLHVVMSPDPGPAVVADNPRGGTVGPRRCTLVELLVELSAAAVARPVPLPPGLLKSAGRLRHAAVGHGLGRTIVNRFLGAGAAGTLLAGEVTS